MNAGVRNPRRSALICLVLLTASAIALVSGIVAMMRSGAETGFSAGAIGLGILGCVIFTFMLINFAWGMRVFSAMHRGENVIARWTVPADVFDRFRANEAKHAADGYPNDYKPPRHTPPAGIGVIFAADGVIVGDIFFGLATTGLAHIRQAGIVPGDPLCLGFQTALTTGRVTSSGAASFRTAQGLLRIPVPDAAHADAKTVLDHYIAALSGQILVKPDFWPKRMRWGLWTALVAAIVSACGFGLEAVEAEVGELPVVLAVAGAVIALGGLVLAFLAWTFAGRQRRGRRSDGSPA
jgi:hypothetical protein